MLPGYELNNSEEREENAKVLGKNWRIKTNGLEEENFGSITKNKTTGKFYST